MKQPTSPEPQPQPQPDLPSPTEPPPQPPQRRGRRAMLVGTLVGLAVHALPTLIGIVLAIIVLRRSSRNDDEGWAGAAILNYALVGTFLVMQGVLVIGGLFSVFRRTRRFGVGLLISLASVLVFCGGGYFLYLYLSTRG